MILVDTSVWVDHLRRGDNALVRRLTGHQVLMHPFVLGELACGNLQRRAEVLGYLARLPHAAVAKDEEVLDFIERHRLMGQGLGYVDVHLLAAVALSAPAALWTRDKRLHGAAQALRMVAP